MAAFSYSVKVNTIQNPKASTKAFANLIIEDILEVCGFRIVDGRNGLFVSPPQKKGADDKWYNDVRFLEEKDENEHKGKFQTEVENEILKEYRKVAGTSRGSSATAHTEQSTNNAAKEAMNRRPMY